MSCCFSSGLSDIDKPETVIDKPFGITMFIKYAQSPHACLQRELSIPPSPSVQRTSSPYSVSPQNFSQESISRSPVFLQRTISLSSSPSPAFLQRAISVSPFSYASKAFLREASISSISSTSSAPSTPQDFLQRESPLSSPGESPVSSPNKFKLYTRYVENCIKEERMCTNRKVISRQIPYTDILPPILEPIQIPSPIHNL